MNWLKRLFQVKTGGTLGAGPPRPLHLPVKPPAEHQTAGDILDYACKKHEAKYEIFRDPDSGTVVVDIKLKDGHTVVSGQGTTTKEAVERAVRKLGST
jgi:hypothetical protein